MVVFFSVATSFPVYRGSIYLFNILSAGAHRLSTSSRWYATENSPQRFERGAARSTWSSGAATRAACRSRFILAFHFLPLCRHAGRREGCLGTPPLAPCPAISPLLPSLPSLLSFTPSLAPGVGVGGCGLGGREGGVILELTGISSTSRSLDARLTLALVLARRSLDFFTSTQRARLWRLTRARGGRPFLRSKPDSQWRPIQGIRGLRIWFDRLLNSTTSLLRVSVATPSAVF